MFKLNKINPMVRAVGTMGAVAALARKEKIKFEQFFRDNASNNTNINSNISNC